jgi:acetylornithine deacetylase/succinyl-diaminopimelate desuccinylase-like protein
MKIPVLYNKLLTEFLAFKTISSLPGSADEMQSCVTWLQKLFQEYGLETKLLTGVNSNPIVYAEYFKDEKCKTLLIYGHYDVQPAAEADGWHSDPFKLTSRDGRFWGRGVIDNKGQVLLHLVTVFQLIKTGKIKYNIKFLLEGNEETGSAELGQIISTNKALLKADHILISDGTLAADSPVIEVGFRGSASVTLKYITAKNNVHSGIYGNTIPNAAHELSKLISRLFDDEDRVMIPNFEAGLDSTLKAQVDPGQDLEKLKADIGIGKFFLTEGLEFHAKNGLHPALIITGIKTGYTGPGYSNIIPKEAEVRLNFRFAPGQDPRYILDQFHDYVKKHTPDFVTALVTEDYLGKGIKLNYDLPLFLEIKKQLEKIYGHEVVYKYVGGSLPIITDFKDVLGLDPASIPLANEDSNMHGVDENFTFKKVEQGLDLSRMLLS